MSRTATGTVGLATSPGILDPACQPRQSNFLHVTGAAANDLDPVACQKAYGPTAHVPGQHHGHPHAGQLWDDARLAAAAGRGGQGLFRYDLVLVINIKDGETLAMAKVLIDFDAI